MTASIAVSHPESGVALVELSRGKVNALDSAMYRELADVFEELSDREDTTVAVLTGKGKNFCGGNDLHEFQSMSAENGDRRMREIRRGLFSVMDCAVPVVAAVNGAALGSGLGLTAVCDVVVASDRAVFGLPEMNVGVLGGGRFAARMLPQQAVRRLFFTAEPVGAATMRDWGAPIEVVPESELLNVAMMRARSIAAKNRYAVTLAKQSLNGCESLDLKRGYELEQSFTVRLADNPHAKAAVDARIEQLARKDRS
ncbi:enoyl-CoA hydratase-related protein [Rhodococcus sp. MEB041]|uniref:enoyl-CoA hydratase-related protein n=1 Tax=Rhodococcus sp. MEB041 TaxID=3040323 RepID=UPI00254A68D1|nr:enoyl-CoA hydratase-related protein [Rhodococcus sp. MEB041]